MFFESSIKIVIATYLSFDIMRDKLPDRPLESKWMGLEDAAAYIGVGKTVLYQLCREERVPAKKLGKKWVFDKDQLDRWMNANQPMNTFFLNLDASIEGNEALREPQKDAYLRTYEFLTAGNNKAILQIPVGCGKSGLASILPINISRGRVLIMGLIYLSSGKIFFG